MYLALQMDRSVSGIRDKRLRGRRVNKESESRVLGKTLERKGLGGRPWGVVSIRFLDGVYDNEKG